MWVCRLPVHIGPLESCEFAEDFRKIGIFCGRTESSAPTNCASDSAFHLAESSAVRYDRQIKFRQKPLRVKGVLS